MGTKKAKPKKYVIIRERSLQSFLQDVFTFGVITFSFWFNYHFIGGNDLLDLLLFLIFLIFAIGKAVAMKERLDAKVEEDA